MAVEDSLKHILIVDDDPIQLEYYIAVLEHEYQIMTANDIGEAIDMLTDVARVDALICDLHLGFAHSGVDLLAWVETHRPELMNHSVIISGDVVVDSESFAVPVVFKPLEPALLTQSVQQLLMPTASHFRLRG
ncbi:MAG: response regulator [Zetaproteobacteria bacterium CG12_big_fil_rev_8_21_14_0_65_54_13]|nr:MAG: response regulator [Zetaproteobacteria bacterium CG23_combo_of_CG06-09_8_20_14_all_54_7]PIW47920.1 MAG: response regulator [Zetaproteobacteria bacterium CG12_big_fil_rev_8_21_14_0_65_54_13]PIX53818.1 MAG: response regulator [Zetaproteobacteria bacterium CG_4_10_14_3_um_filter_54_28]PJA30840.1 MAG: response regulator [Zetaproteobacteria bacterium CG_4_9_14_3_um_filter_54_145]